MNKRKKRNRIISILLVFLLVLGDPSTMRVLAEGLSAVEISLPDLEGKAGVSGGDAVTTPESAGAGSGTQP